MCGWVGVFGAPATSHALRAAAATLATRGPDGAGERVLDPAGPLPGGLGHRRLAILDPTPAGAQPMHDAERRVSVAYNGEIYNSPALRKELEAKGARFRSATDTEVLLHAWAEWGDGVLARIEGIFSFALVDERRGRVLLARDRLGVKPLYWAHDGGTLLAGSAPRALLALRPDLGAHLDRVALAQFLTLLWIPHPRTPWTRIHKLPPATALSFEAGQARQWAYWTPPEPTGLDDDRLETDRLRHLLEEATARQLLSDVPVGLLLSGGLDSSLLLAFMARHYDGPKLHALTAAFGTANRLEHNPDDAVYARLVAGEHPSVELTEVAVHAPPEGEMDTLAAHFDDPVADPAAVTLYRLCRASDTKVLLSGVGGEELFAGYPRHGALATARRAASLPAPARSALATATSVLRGGQPGPLYGARRNAQKLARAVGGTRPAHYWRMVAQLTFAEVEALVPGAAAEAFDELDALAPPIRTTTLAGALAFDRSQFLPNLNLAYADKAAMATGVEVRVPLLDEAVVAAAWAMPASALIAGGQAKAPLRDAARGLVPPAVIEREKSGFGGPVRAWWQGAPGEHLRARVAAAGGAGLVPAEPARRLVDAAVTGRADAALAAWALACLQAWHDHHATATANPPAPAPARAVTP